MLNILSAYAKSVRNSKEQQKKNAKIPLRDDIAPDPFHTVQVDLIGPWSVEVEQANTKVTNIQLKALTMIDVGTFLLEIVPYHDKEAASITRLFDQEWLCRYPRPAHDNGNEFLGAEF